MLAYQKFEKRDSEYIYKRFIFVFITVLQKLHLQFRNLEPQETTTAQQVYNRKNRELLNN